MLSPFHPLSTDLISQAKMDSSPFMTLEDISERAARYWAEDLVSHQSKAQTPSSVSQSDRSWPDIAMFLTETLAGKEAMERACDTQGEKLHPPIANLFDR